MTASSILMRLKDGFIVRNILWALSMLLVLPFAGLKADAQNTPLISGGVGFLTTTNGGVTALQPVISPVAAVPLGEHLLVESRAYISDFIAPKNGNSGPYQGDFFAGLQYLQLDYLATPKVTLTVGDFLTPFATYNERLTPIWISKFQDAPLIYPIGNQHGSSIGVMLRGNAYSAPHVRLNYAGYFSVSSSVKAIHRRTGVGRTVFDVPPRQAFGDWRLLLAASAGPAGQLGGRRCVVAAIPRAARDSLRVRAWSAARRVIGWKRPIGCLNGMVPIAGWDVWNLYFACSRPSATVLVQDQLPAVNTQRADFGLDYHLPHEVRVNTSYSRQFASTGNTNIWETTVTYRFLFPAWKGRSK